MYAVPPSYGPPAGGPIQRLSLSQIIDETLKLYRRHFLIFFTIALLMAIPGLLLTLAMRDFQSSYLQELLRISEMMQVPGEFEQQFPNPEVTFRPFFEQTISIIMLILGIAVVNTFVFRTLAIGLTTAAVGIIYSGDKPTFEGTFSRAFLRLNTLLGWGLVLAALVLMPFFLFTFGLAMGAGVLILCMGLLFLIWPFVALGYLARLLFGARAIVAENIGVGAAWRRSRELSQSSTLRILGFALALFIGAAIAGSLLTGAASAIFVSGADPFSTPITLLIFSTVVTALLDPIVHIGLTLLYFDYRRISDMPRTQQGPYGQYVPPQEGM